MLFKLSEAKGTYMNNIKEIIREKGLQLSWVAEKLEAHPSHLSMWISEDRYPSQERLVKMAKLLKVKVKDLYPNIKTKYTYIFDKDND